MAGGASGRPTRSVAADCAPSCIRWTLCRLLTQLVAHSAVLIRAPARSELVSGA